MKTFFTETRELHPVVYDDMDHSANGYIHPGEILFVNWESINKDNALMIRDTEQSASLYDLTRRTQIEHEIPLIVIIDEDYRSENTSGLGIRALAEAIQKEGFEVLGVTSYGDLSQFAQQQSRASAFILSIDDEEFTPGPDLDPAVLNLRAFIQEVRRKNLDVPIYIYGETKTSRHLPNDILRELHGFIHMFEDTPEFVAKHIIREAKSYLDSVQPPFFKALIHHSAQSNYSWHTPGHAGGVAFTKSPVGRALHQFYGENTLRSDLFCYISSGQELHDMRTFTQLMNRNGFLSGHH
jgi:hypothetical protein